MFSSIGSTAALVSSGLLAWQVYQTQLGNHRLEELKEKLHTQQKQHMLLIEELNKTEFIETPKDFSETFKHCDDLGYIETKEHVASMLPREARKVWRLLHKANTGGYEQHIQAVQELSKMNLSDGECQELAQSCECRTAVGLARSSKVDLRLFLSPPPLPPGKQGELLEMFREILTQLPAHSADLHECIKHFTSTALDQYLHHSEEEVMDTDISTEFHRESHHIHSIPRPSINQETLIEHCLQAILSHSTVEEQCSVLMESMALPLFSMVIEAHPDNARIKSIIGKIISNVSLHPRYHRAIFRSGWVGILASWKQSPNLLISLPATKALCNMDQEYGVDKFKPGIYLMVPNDRHVQHKNSKSNSGVDVVFVHGLTGGLFYTWRQQDLDNTREFSHNQISEDNYSYCWPRDWLADDDIRVIGCDFDSYLSQWGGSCPTQSFTQTLEERSEDMLRKLREAGVGNRPVIFVGHSMGGLIIKKMLTSAQDSEDEAGKKLSENTKGVVFYSTPHEGSQIASLHSIIKYFFFPSVEVQELEMNSPALLALNQSFKHFVSKFKTKVISFGETLPTRHLGVDLTFVPPESSNPGVGEFYPVPFNHIDICKPASHKSILFRKFYTLVWDTVDQAEETSNGFC